MNRTEQARAFIKDTKWSDARVLPLAGDASNRRYQRLIRPDGTSAVLMDAPPRKGEKVDRFVLVATYLTDLGLSAPRIFKQDCDAGFLLLEDFGDHLFAREMVSDPALQLPLYRAAADVLTRLHAAAPPKFEPYDSTVTVPLAALCYDWYQFGVQDHVNTANRDDFKEEFQSIIAPYDRNLTVMIQRDFHAENLLWLPNRAGVARVGLLDFQDAMLGHAAYDLVSILQDARRDVAADIERDILAYFVAQTGHEMKAFEMAYALFGLQRNLRILGVFSRLCLRDGKAHYVDFIPRVWGHVQTNLRHPALSGIARLINDDLPAPRPEVCAALKVKSGQWTGR